MTLLCLRQEREDRELRKKQADAEAAKIYASFVASFETEDETLGKAFVREAVRVDCYRLSANGLGC